MVSVHTVRRVQSPSRTAHDRRPAIISTKYAAHCHGMHFPLFVNYWNFGGDGMIVTSKCAIKNIGAYLILSSLPLFVPTIFLSIHCHCTSYLTCHIIPHIYGPILLIFHHFWRKNRQQCSGRDVRLFTLSESNRCRPVRTRSVTSNILAQQRRRNGTETWRRRCCQCEHLRLIIQKKILLNGDVLRRNGNVTYSVNRP
jgi:hypothetical protein